MIFKFVLLPSTFLTVVLATNDWTKPCFSGVCQYDLPASSGASSGTLKIWGTQNSIGDITPAGGWEIIDCSPNAVNQDIRLVCKDGRAADCGLLHATGAEGKIVRLPESCGLNAFAVVTSSWVPTDQSIPANVKASLVRRDGSTPQVRALRLSTNFHEVDTSSKTTGTVNFAIQAANVPGASGDIKLGAPQKRTVGRISERGLFDFVGSAINKISSLNDFNVNKSSKVLPFNVDKNFNLVNEKLSCPPIEATLKIDVDAKAQGSATIGVAISGTILPPKVQDFALISSLSADLEGSVDVTAAISGKLDSGKKNLVTIPIAGIDFPGILSVGPSFTVDAQATASLEVDLGLTVGINYKIDNAQLVFPPSSKKASGGSFKIGDTPLTLSAGADIKATGTIEAHIIPGLTVGLNVFSNVAKANIFLELDGSASLNLGVEAAASGSVVKQVGKREVVHARDNQQRRSGSTLPPKVALPAAIHSSTSTAPSKPTISSTKAVSKTSTSTSVSKPTASSTSPKAISKTPTSSTVSSSAVSTTSAPSKVVNNSKATSFSGCVTVDAGLDVNAGADASFFGLFNKNTKVSLFSKKFELLKKCFGNAISKRSSNASRFSSPSTWSTSVGRAPLLEGTKLSDRAVKGLSCPASGTASTKSVVSQVVPAASIKQL